jgi:molybdopterin converting factor small subunit
MTGGQTHVDVDTSGSTLRDALEALFAAHPALRDRVLTEQGEIRHHVNVFVGKSEARTMEGLATPLENGMEISIIPAISGGCLPEIEPALMDPSARFEFASALRSF